MNLSGESLTLRERVSSAAWVGWLGGILFGLTEAWTILGNNASESGSALIGVVAAMGFVIALDGAVGAVGLGIFGAVAAQVHGLRLRFSDSTAWVSLCTAFFAGLLAFLKALHQLGVLGGAAEGFRAALFAGLSLLVGAMIGGAVYVVIRAAYASIRESVARVARGAIVATWIVAALAPLAFALLRSRLA